jgi:hypothetical protein
MAYIDLLMDKGNRYFHSIMKLKNEMAHQSEAEKYFQLERSYPPIAERVNTEEESSEKCPNR